MAQTSTVYQLSVELSDMDRGVYETFKLSVALHPSESMEFMTTRVLAYCLEYGEGITFSRGVGAPEDPTVSLKGLDGSYKIWIEIGSPDPERLHKAAKISERVAVYSHRPLGLLLQALRQRQIFRGEEISVYTFAPDFIRSVSSAVERRSDFSVSRSDQTLYVTINGRDFSSAVVESRIS